jgi:hypothetical protein
MVKGVIVMVGDSLCAGFNSAADVGSAGPFGENGSDKVFVYNRWLSSDLLDRAGLASNNAPFGWSSLPYSTSNWQFDGPVPAYFLANAITRFMGLEELRVIMMGVPATDLVQSPPNNNSTVSWYPGIASNGAYDRFETYFIDEALATGDLTNDHLYLGAFASLGNNQTNSSAYPVDETDDFQPNLNTLFDAIEDALLAPTDTGRRIVTKVPLSALEVEPNVELDRVRQIYKELNAWKAEALGGTTFRATADLNDIAFLGPGNPHYSATSTLVMGQRLFKAWLSSAQSTMTEPNIVVT